VWVRPRQGGVPTCGTRFRPRPSKRRAYRQQALSRAREPFSAIQKVQQRRAASLNNPVGTNQYRMRNLEAKRRRGLCIDDELKFVGQLHWQLCRLGTFEDLGNVACREAPELW